MLRTRQRGVLGRIVSPSPKSRAARLRGRTRPRLAGPNWDHFLRFGCSRMLLNALEVAFCRVRCRERKPLKIKGNTAKPTSYGMEAWVGIEPTNKGFADHLSNNHKLLNPRELELISVLMGPGLGPTLRLVPHLLLVC